MAPGRVRRPLAGLRGALTFLTRVPVRALDGLRGEPASDSDRRVRDWDAFRSRPYSITLVGWIVGALVAVPFLASGAVPAPTVAVAYLVVVYLVTGVHHLDGVADLGDALVVHGDADRRREVLKDTTTGVGAVLAVALTVAGLGFAGLSLAAVPGGVAVAVVVAAEVGAKTGMAAMACFGRAAHVGLGSQLTGVVGPRAFTFPAVLAVPTLLLTWPHPAAGFALVGALIGVAGPWWWARDNLEGVTGDVFGAANEIGRLVGLHAGVIAWTLW